MKKTYYFPHDFNARNDPKKEELFLKWGCEGRGIYWTFIEMLYENNGYLPFDKIDYYANAMRTDSERIGSVLNNFELFKNDGKVFWSESCLSRLNEIKQKSEKARESSHKRWHKDANAMQSECDRNARKESKVKESKVNTLMQFFEYFTLKTKKNYKFTPERQKIIATRLEQGYTLDQLKQATDNFMQDDWVDRNKFCDIVYCIGVRNKVDNLEKWLNFKPKVKQEEFVKP